MKDAQLHINISFALQKHYPNQCRYLCNPKCPLTPLNALEEKTYSSSSIELASGPKKGTSNRSSVAAMDTLATVIYSHDSAEIEERNLRSANAREDRQE